MFKRPIFLAAIISVVFSCTVIIGFPEIFFSHSSYKEGEKYTVSGRVYKIEENDYSFHLFISRNQLTDRKIIIILYKTSFPTLDNISIGNTISCTSKFKEFIAPRNHGNYDEEKYYHSIGISSKFVAVNYVITDNHVNIPANAAYKLKCLLFESIRSIVNSEDNDIAGTLSAMLSGNKSELSEEITDLYKTSGISHILAISGLHISLIGIGLFKLLRKIMKMSFAVVIAALLVVFYCLLSGFSVSAIRATVMILVRLGAYYFGKKYDLICSISLPLIFLLVENPFYLVNTGFLLSFGAVFSLALFNEMAFSKEGSNNKSVIFNKLLGPSCAITLSTLPIVLSVYYGFPLYGVVINIVVLPLVSYVMPLGLLGSMIGIVSIPLGRFVIGISVYLLKLINSICGIIGELPCAYIITGNVGAPKIIIYYLLLLTMVLFNKFLKNRGRIVYVNIILIVCLAVTVIVGNKKNNLQVSFIDVGQGECILVMSPSGNAYMVDCGSSSENDVYRNIVSGTLKYYGVAKIDGLFVTHPDSDHVSGVIELLGQENETDVSSVIIPYTPQNENYATIKQLAEENGINIVTAEAGYRINDGVISFLCLSPEPGEGDIDENDISAVWLLAYKDFTALFTGDISSKKEKELLSNNLIPSNIDILDAPHHGSKSSNCNEFLRKCRAAKVIISAGVDNIYGHPHQETLDRIAYTGAAVICTKDAGEIDIFVSDTGGVSIKTYITYQ